MNLAIWRLRFGPYKLDCWDFLWFRKGFICSKNGLLGLLGVPRGAQKVRKWVSDASPVIIGQFAVGVFELYIPKEC